MNILSIHIDLGPNGATGTLATVQTKRVRALFWPVVERHLYECHRSSPVMGAQWIDVRTGISAPDDLSCRINEAAQASARLAQRISLDG